MYWSTTCKVETTENKGPTMGIPSPACNGIVDDGAPYEDEYEEGTKSTTFSDTANGESRTVCMNELERREIL